MAPTASCCRGGVPLAGAGRRRRQGETAGRRLADSSVAERFDTQVLIVRGSRRQGVMGSGRRRRKEKCRGAGVCSLSCKPITWMCGEMRSCAVPPGVPAAPERRGWGVNLLKCLGLSFRMSTRRVGSGVFVLLETLMIRMGMHGAIARVCWVGGSHLISSGSGAERLTTTGFWWTSR